MTRTATRPVQLGVFQQMASSPKGLTEAEAALRLHKFGENRLPTKHISGIRSRARSALASPFVALLTVLGVVFLGLGDARGAITVAVMVGLSIALRYWQHARSDRAVYALRERVSSTVTVRRRADTGSPACAREVPVSDIVPGDMLVLGPGDVIPADLRIVTANGLRIDQSALSGEALPVTKALPRKVSTRRGHDSPELCFAGTSVVAGSARAIVTATGTDTQLGSLALPIARPESSFDRGVRSVGWTLIRFMLVLAPLVFVVNGTVTGNWAQAVMFAMAVAVGLTPEMLPVIVTTNLARGALRLSARKVIVSRLNAIQDLGAMDVLCVDKTGTLTEDRVTYAHSITPAGQLDDEAAEYAYLAVHMQDNISDRLDEAIAEQLSGAAHDQVLETLYTTTDERPFDHERRTSTITLRATSGEPLLITKGDPEEIVPRCKHFRGVDELGRAQRLLANDIVRGHAEHGMRILAVAAGTSETDLTLVGFVGFTDPVRAGAEQAVRALSEHGVRVTILTGDNANVAGKVATTVGVHGEVILGEQIDHADAVELRTIVKHSNIFAKLTPAQKTRIVDALRAEGHVVGVLGDGVNDAPALRIADVGIAPDTATEVAKNAADLILLDKDLGVLVRGVVEGRRTLANTLKYVSITASSNFGNVLTVLAASAFLPFLPMLPIQLMVQNLLYDSAQLTLPWDRAEKDYLRKPRSWDARGLTTFMLTFGPLSSLFDLSTFAVLWWIFGAQHSPALFQTGWFVEGLLTQVLIVLVLRTRSWRAPLPARPVVYAPLAVVVIGLLLPFSPLAGAVHLTALPGGYALWLCAVLLAYGAATQWIKTLYLRRHQEWFSPTH